MHDQNKDSDNIEDSGNEAEEFLRKVIIKIFASFAIMAVITVVAIYTI